MAEITLLVEKNRHDKGTRELRVKSYLRAVWEDKGAWWGGSEKEFKERSHQKAQEGRQRPVKETMWTWTSLVTSRTFFPARDQGTTSKNFWDCPMLLQLIPPHPSTHTPGAPPQRLLASLRLSSSLRYKGKSSLMAPAELQDTGCCGLPQ